MDLTNLYLYIILLSGMYQLYLIVVKKCMFTDYSKSKYFVFYTVVSLIHTVFAICGISVVSMNILFLITHISSIILYIIYYPYQINAAENKSIDTEQKTQTKHKNLSLYIFTQIVAIMLIAMWMIRILISFQLLANVNISPATATLNTLIPYFTGIFILYCILIIMAEFNMYPNAIQNHYNKYIDDDSEIQFSDESIAQQCLVLSYHFSLLIPIATDSLLTYDMALNGIIVYYLYLALAIFI